MQSRVTEEEFSQREVTFLDIANDKVPDKHYKESEVSHVMVLPSK